jgi:ribosomal-protein-serine acetyltransferase
MDAEPPQAPEQIFIDGGLLLRHLALGDADLVFAATDGDREYLRRWLPWVDGTRSVDDTLAFIRETEELRARGQRLAYGIWQNNEFCGVIGSHDIDWASRNIQLGYWLREAAQGKGIITRACREMIRMAFEDFEMERVDIRVALGNDRSRAVVARLQFHPDGVLRHGAKLNGRFIDLEVFSLLAGEHRERATRP